MAESYRHPIFARCYAWLSEHSEGRVGEYRARLLSGLSGRVVEVGAGNGLNFAHYPPEVDHVLAVEPEPHLRGVAERNAQPFEGCDAPVGVHLRAAASHHLPGRGVRADHGHGCSRRER